MTCSVARKLLAAWLAVALVTVAWVPQCYAPQREKPEKLNIDGVVWNSTAQAFLVEDSARFGIATAGDNADFKIRTVLAILDWDGSLIDVVTQEDQLVPQKGLLPSADGFTSLAPQMIPWDPPRFGSVVVMAVSEVLNPDGQQLTATSAMGTVLIE